MYASRASAYGTDTGPRAARDRRDRALVLVDVEPMTGIEPAFSAWEADVLPLNYIGVVASEG